MKNTFTFLRLYLISLPWCIWLFVVGFASLGNQCGCLKNAFIDNSRIDDTSTDNIPPTLSLQFEKLSYDRGNNRLVVIIKNTGKKAVQDLSLRCTNISQDEASRTAVLFNNTATTATISIPELAAGLSTQEIYVAIDFQTAQKALVQMEIISGQQVAKTDAIQINQYPIELLNTESTIVIVQPGEMGELKWKLVTDGQVDFNAISLKVEKFPETNIDVSVEGTTIVLTQSIHVATITGADLEKLAKQKEILVKVKNNTTEIKLIGCTLLDRDKEIAKIGNMLLSDIKAALLPAAALGDVKLLKQAIASGAKVDNVKNAKDESALHLATQGGHSEIIQILLKNGADVNAKNNDGNTALHVAARLQRQEIVETLLAHGADKDIKNNNNETTADLAKDQTLKDLINNSKK